MLELRQAFRTIRKPFEEMLLGVVTELESTVGWVVRVLVLAVGEGFWHCEESRSNDFIPRRMVSSGY